MEYKSDVVSYIYRKKHQNSDSKQELPTELEVLYDLIQQSKEESRKLISESDWMLEIFCGLLAETGG